MVRGEEAHLAASVLRIHILFIVRVGRPHGALQNGRPVVGNHGSDPLQHSKKLSLRVKSSMIICARARAGASYGAEAYGPDPTAKRPNVQTQLAGAAQCNRHNRASNCIPSGNAKLTDALLAPRTCHSVVRGTAQRRKECCIFRSKDNKC